MILIDILLNLVSGNIDYGYVVYYLKSPEDKEKDKILVSSIDGNDFSPHFGIRETGITALMILNTRNKFALFI